jgi:pimeloyl-ACP methyl ester carboxylesterase
MPSVEVNGCKIHYVQIDCEAGNHCQDLVMIHGLAASLAFWYLPHACQFSKQYRITLYDLRGHGRSNVSDSGYTPSNMGKDLQGLLDTLNIKRAHFIAHSYGGAVALSLACLDPARLASLVLVDTHISAVRRLPKTRNWEFGKKIQPVLNQHGLNVDVGGPYFGFKLLSAAARFRRQKGEAFRKREDWVSPVIGQFGKRTAMQWLNLMETTRARQELMTDDGLSLTSLRNLRFPILAMYGEHSLAMPTGEQLLEVWPHADFRRLRDAGHFFPITRPVEFMDNCWQFWNGGLPNKLPQRAGDGGKRFFRSNRFYSREGKWYFDTRESTKQGPFGSLGEAQQYLGSMISSVQMRAAAP